MIAFVGTDVTEGLVADIPSFQDVKGLGIGIRLGDGGDRNQVFARLRQL